MEREGERERGKYSGVSLPFASYLPNPLAKDSGKCSLQAKGGSRGPAGEEL